MSTVSWNGTHFDEVSTENNSSHFVESTTSGSLGTVPSTDASDYFSLIYVPFIFLVGIFGNSFTVILMNAGTYTNTTLRIFLTALAISDTTVICSQPFNLSFFIKFVGRDLRALGVYGCKSFFVIRRSCKIISSWIVVLLCIERFVVVWMPLKAHLICTKRTTLICIFFMVIAVLGFNIFSSWSMKIKLGMCYPDIYNKDSPDEVATFGALIITCGLLHSGIPLLLLSTLSPLIVHKILTSVKKRKEMTFSSTKSSSSLSKDSTTPKATPSQSSRVTAILLGIVIAYIILEVPLTILHMAAYAKKWHAFETNLLTHYIFKQVAQNLELLNYSINFFLYVITSAKFRKAFFAMVTCKTE